MGSALISEKSSSLLVLGFLVVLWMCGSSEASIHLPGNYMRTYSQGAIIWVKVNSLTSIGTLLPFSYYSLLYCVPQNGIKKSPENLGELLMGDQITNSPYKFYVNVNESFYLCTTNPLSEREVELLKQRTRDFYQLNMVLDEMPARRFTARNGIVIQWTRFPVGYTPAGSSEDYIINHLKFRVLIREHEQRGVEIMATGEEGLGMLSKIDNDRFEYEIVGFEVLPCSVKRDPVSMLCAP